MSGLSALFSPMSVGPFLLGAPLALAALIALPIIWFILRATPPAPKSAELPSLRLLDDIDPREETPDRTPWWVLLLRLAAAALAIIGLAQPVYAPAGPTEAGMSGPLLVVIDDGWAAAPRWADLIAAADAAIEGAGRDTGVHILLTAPRERAMDVAERRTTQEAGRILDTLDPVSWPVDRADALERLEASGLQPGQILYASHGLTEGTDGDFINALSNLAPTRAYVASPRGALAISALQPAVDGVSVTLERASGDGPLEAAVSAVTLDGAALATATAQFEAGSRTATALFALPGGALSRISRFRVTGTQGAGLTWLWDSADRTRRVGLVASGGSAQPLLSDVHYVRRALEPFASVTEGELSELVQQRPDAIILTDIGVIPPTEIDALVEWIESGGALIRFAGPRLAAQDDQLLPVPLRRASRALGGALAWDEPQPLDRFPEASPFSGLALPADVRVRRQVLAQPAADLQVRTWARLADGSPVVTAASRGAGTIILFHVTAGPEWSDLPFSATYAQMLRRAIAAGRGEITPDADGSLVPQLVLDGFGQLEAPASTAQPMTGTEFETVRPSESHPPGFYRGPAGTRALNTAAGTRYTPIASWPARVELLGDVEARRIDLTGLLIAIALGLIALDLLVALSLSGRMLRFGARQAGAGLIIGALMFGAAPQDASAQLLLSARGEEGLTKAEAAAINMRFGYVETGDAELDRRTEAGLIGLSSILFRRTSVEPVRPHALDLESDALEVYPLIYYSVPTDAAPLSDTAIAALNRYMRAGGALVIDTRAGDRREEDLSSMSQLLEGLDALPMAPVPSDHVLTRSFYLINNFPGRFEQRRLWIETAGDAGAPSGDGVSRLFIGDADWVGAWAVDERARPLYSVDGGNDQREMAYRFGVNLVMYVLTGNYKSDQVHIPALLERLGGERDREEDFDLDDLPATINDGGPR